MNEYRNINVLKVSFFKQQKLDKQDYGHADSYRVATKTEMKEKAPQQGRQGRRVAGQKPKEEVKKDVTQLKVS